MSPTTKILSAASCLGALALLNPPLSLGPEDLVSTTNGVEIAVPGYSVPSLADWDGDGREDLVVGEGGFGIPGKVRVYLNVGSSLYPRFAGHFFAQAVGSDLAVPSTGCMGAFPRVVQWDGDGRKDLLVGRADGKLQLFLNVNTNTSPAFDAGTLLQYGPAGAKVDINVGARATPAIVDWDGDGDKDLVVGAYSGKLHLFVNQGTHFAPDFPTQAFVADPAGDLVVPGGRSSPVVRDLDGDGVLDILAGNTLGQVLYYHGPQFAPAIPVEAAGVPIDLPGSARSRLAVGHWTGDSALDLLVGGGDGKVRLYQGESCDLILDADPVTAGAGVDVDFTIARGNPGAPVLLVLVGINGVPFLSPFLFDAFGSNYEATITSTVPPGLSGLVLDFGAYGFTMCGAVGQTNVVTVTLQ